MNPRGKHDPDNRGLSKTPIYQVWKGIRNRCLFPNSPAYHNYGGRGIGVCQEWLKFTTFQKWAVDNGYRHGPDIDRIDNDLGYSPENCRFVTRRENCRNMRTCLKIDVDGKTMVGAEAAEALGISVITLRSRLRRGWSMERAVQPVEATKCAMFR